MPNDSAQFAPCSFLIAFFRRMSLYERFNDETEFRKNFVKPLLNRLGYYGVSELHGTQEFGKDFVFSELHRLGGMRHYAAQVKHEKTINQGTSVDGLLSQVKQAFAKPFKRADSPRECHVSAVYVFNSGEITDNAKEQLLRGLEREHYGDNVHFLDGERLDALNNWATLVTDANARARLLGLRLSLRATIRLLEGHEVSGFSLQPTFRQGIELYLSEPVNSDDQLIQSLMSLLQRLKTLELLNTVLWKFVGSKNAATQSFMEKQSLFLKDNAKEAVSLAKDASKRVDALIEKMKPLV
jgi:hypothetical protein